MSTEQLKSERDELLVIFMEECAEATVEAAKLIRFGSPTMGNVAKMEVEVGDLMCMVQLLSEYGIINSAEVESHSSAKRIKLKKWSNLDV